MNAETSSRAALFARLPDTQEAAIALLRSFNAAGLAWHLDDSPETLDCFSRVEMGFCSRLVERLNALWADDPRAQKENATGVWNPGAWIAAERAGWFPVEEIP